MHNIVSSWAFSPRRRFLHDKYPLRDGRGRKSFAPKLWPTLMWKSYLAKGLPYRALRCAASASRNYSIYEESNGEKESGQCCHATYSQVFLKFYFQICLLISDKPFIKQRQRQRGDGTCYPALADQIFWSVNLLIYSKPSVFLRTMWPFLTLNA